MGGVDLWKNEDDVSDTYLPQSMHDKKLEVVSFTGMLHLGRLQVRLYGIRLTFDLRPHSVGCFMQTGL
jgi:hypothetical protein